MQVDCRAVNLEQGLLMVQITGENGLKATGLARITAYYRADMETRCPKDEAVWAGFQLANIPYFVPLASNLGDWVGIDAQPGDIIKLPRA
jgi:hypothetical protein